MRHYLGDTRPETSVQREGRPKVQPLDEDGNAITREAANKMLDAAKVRHSQCLAAGKRKPRRGPKAAGWVDWMIAGPSWDTGDDGIRDWVRDSVAWVSAGMGPGSRIGVVSLHLDEAEPHLHILAVAADEQDRLGWNGVRDGFNRTGKKLTGRYLMTAMQDGYHAIVGRKHGLERGERGSKATHRAIDRTLGLQARLDQQAADLGEQHRDELAAARTAAHAEGRREGEAAGRKATAERLGLQHRGELAAERDKARFEGHQRATEGLTAKHQRAIKDLTAKYQRAIKDLTAKYQRATADLTAKHKTELEQTRTDGHQAGRQAGHQAGRAEGEAAGREAATAELTAQHEADSEQQAADAMLVLQRLVDTLAVAYAYSSDAVRSATQRAAQSRNCRLQRTGDTVTVTMGPIKMEAPSLSKLPRPEDPQRDGRRQSPAR